MIAAPALGAVGFTAQGVVSGKLRPPAYAQGPNDNGDVCQDPALPRGIALSVPLLLLVSLPHCRVLVLPAMVSPQ